MFFLSKSNVSLTHGWLDCKWIQQWRVFSSFSQPRKGKGKGGKGDKGGEDGDDNEGGQEETLTAWFRSCFSLRAIEYMDNDVSSQE